MSGSRRSLRGRRSLPSNKEVRRELDRARKKKRPSSRLLRVARADGCTASGVRRSSERSLRKYPSFNSRTPTSLLSSSAIRSADPWPGGKSSGTLARSKASRAWPLADFRFLRVFGLLDLRLQLGHIRVEFLNLINASAFVCCQGAWRLRSLLNHNLIRCRFRLPAWSLKRVYWSTWRPGNTIRRDIFQIIEVKHGRHRVFLFS